MKISFTFEKLLAKLGFGAQVKRSLKQMNRLGAAAVAAGAMMAGSADAADINWGSFDSNPAVAEVSTNGTLIEAIKLVGTDGAAGGTTTANGVNFTNTNLFGNTYNVGTGLPSFGDAGLDALYTGFGYNGGLVTLSGLTVGELYEVQAFYGDNRGCCNTRTYKVSTDFSLPLGSTAESAPDTVAGGLHITGTFTADATTQTFVGVQSANETVTELSAYQLREIDVLPPPTVFELIVNTTSGNVDIENNTIAAIEFDGYQILSPGSDPTFTGSLDAASWNSIAERTTPIAGFPQGGGNGDGWEEGPNVDANELVEWYLDDEAAPSSLASGASIDLGNAFDTSVGDEDIEFLYRLTDGSIRAGIVNYVTSAAVDGDYNNNGIVDAADYAVWREALGVATSLPNEGGISPGVVDTADYNFWKSRFGASSGAGNLASLAVPEPSAMALAFVLLGGLAIVTTSRRNGVPAMSKKQDTHDLVQGSLVAGAVGGSAALATNFYSRPQQVTKRRLLGWVAPVIALAALLASATTVNAAFDERAYLLGDDGSEGFVMNGVTVGSAGGNVAPGRTLDTSGPTGARLDITVGGSPTYTTGALAGSTFGASFNGSSDRLSTGFSVNSPNAMWNNTTFFPGNDYRLNYDGIFNRGMQVWAKPNAATTGVAQTIVQDTLQHGIVITAGDTWAMTFDGDPNASNLTLDSGLAVSSTGQTTGANANEVSANGYTHLMALSGAYVGIPGEPDIFDAQGVGTALGALFYVNGVAVSGTDDFFYDNDSTELSVGSSQDAAGDFYHGDLDDLRIFVWGDNSDTTAANNNGQAVGDDYGTLDLGETNEWIKAELAELGVTDNGDVDLDGDIDNDDVTAFVEDWLKVRLVPEANGDMVVAGDWISRRDNSDLNYDGVTNLNDAFILHESLKAAGAGGLNFALLRGETVPEPSSLVLLGVTIGGLLLRRRVQA